MARVQRVNCLFNLGNVLKAWSDFDVMQNASSSLEVNSCVGISEAENQEEISNKLYLPPELMEKIVCYFDGRTFLKFKSLSDTCNTIANNAIRYIKFWKKICLKEIPKKYLITLLHKQFDSFTPLDSLSEIQYEDLYKHWIYWDNSVFSVTRIGERHFLGYDVINKIICYRNNVKVVLSSTTTVFSLFKNQNATSFKIKKLGMEHSPPNILVIRNPQPQVSGENIEHSLFIIFDQRNLNRCPLKDTCGVNDDNNNEDQPVGKLIDIDTNMYTNVCCWVRESWYEWHSHNLPSIVPINGHYCQQLRDTIYTCVVHGLIVSLLPGNSITLHIIYDPRCVKVHSFLDHKYIRATAFHIYLNILFVGTQNSYLLAYRLQCWDDLINLKEKNLLLETKLGVGQIEKIDILDYENIKAVVVASKDSIYWLKIN